MLKIPRPIDILFLDFDKTITNSDHATNRLEVCFGLDFFEKTQAELKAVFANGFAELLPKIVECTKLCVVTNQVFSQVVRLILAASLTQEQMDKVDILCAPFENFQISNPSGKRKSNKIALQNMNLGEHHDTIQLIVQNPTFTKEEANKVKRAFIALKPAQGRYIIQRVKKTTYIVDYCSRWYQKNEKHPRALFYDDTKGQIQRVCDAKGYTPALKFLNCFVADISQEARHVKDMAIRLGIINHVKIKLPENLLALDKEQHEQLNYVLSSLYESNETFIPRSFQQRLYRPFITKDEIAITCNVCISRRGKSRTFSIINTPFLRFYDEGFFSKVKPSTLCRLEKDGSVTVIDVGRCTKIHKRNSQEQTGFVHATHNEAKWLIQANGLEQKSILFTKHENSKGIIRRYQSMPDLGLSLTRLLKEGLWQEYDEIKKLRIMEKLLLRVKVLHEELSILHLDLSFNNVVYNQESDEVYIIDYGTAISANQNNSAIKIQIKLHHKEDIRNWSYTVKSDIYSIGLLLVQLCEIVIPREIDQLKTLLSNQHMLDRPIFQNNSWLKELILNCLSLDNANARPSIEAVIEEFESGMRITQSNYTL